MAGKNRIGLPRTNCVLANLIELCDEDRPSAQRETVNVLC